MDYNEQSNAENVINSEQSDWNLKPLAEIIGRRPTPEAIKPKTGRVIVLTEPIQLTGKETEPKRYEAEVFNFLLDKKEKLGIKNVLRFDSLMLDGAVDLIDGRRLGLEIKSGLHWSSASVAHWQLRDFLARHNEIGGPIAGGLVFFKDFSGGWEKRPKCRLLENGWNYFYAGYSVVEGLDVDLVRFRNGRIDSFTMPSPKCEADQL
ncbi:MAG: hypothetical protein ABIP78_03830 [Pyrinomonadaceae bacterium]